VLNVPVEVRVKGQSGDVLDAVRFPDRWTAIK
jgi:hypothetical protein